MKYHSKECTKRKGKEWIELKNEKNGHGHRIKVRNPMKFPGYRTNTTKDGHNSHTYLHQGRNGFREVPYIHYGSHIRGFLNLHRQRNGRAHLVDSI